MRCFCASPTAWRPRPDEVLASARAPFRNRGPAPGPPPSPGGRVLSARRVKGPLRRPRRLDAPHAATAELRCARIARPAAVPASRSPLTRRRPPARPPRLASPTLPAALDRRRTTPEHPCHRQMDIRNPIAHGSAGFTIISSLDNAEQCVLAMVVSPEGHWLNHARRLSRRLRDMPVRRAAVTHGTASSDTLA